MKTGDAMAAARKAIETILDTIVPLRARSRRTKDRGITEIPLIPTNHELLGVHITTLMDYREKAVEDLIQSLKYDGSGHAARLSAAVIADYLAEVIAEEKTFSTRPLLIVPVPLHTSRAKERGYNQIGLVLDNLPKEFRDGSLARLVPHILERTRITKPQTRLPRSERLSNVAGAFIAPNAALVNKTHIFLVDDVTTTGATLANAATPLRRAGAEVTLLALARA